MRGQGFGARIWGEGFRVQGLGKRMVGLEFGVRVQGAGFRVQGSGLWAQGVGGQGSQFENKYFAEM